MLALHVKETGENLTPETIDVKIIICGFLAETSVTVLFRNTKDVDLEGDLVFPLNEGATVCGYAVDINGQMVDAVVVEKVYFYSFT